MKKGILLLILLIVASAVLLVFFQTVKGKINKDFTRSLPNVTSPQLTPGPTASESSIKTSLFVPYWSLSGDKTDISEYDTLLYFGVTATKDGIDIAEQGYKNLVLFRKKYPATKSLLVFRMIDRDSTLAILKSANSQEKVITETISLAKKQGFSGVVLDLELSALPFDSLIKQVTSFTNDFAGVAKSSDLQFAMTLYGDTFYRLRPFDVKAIAKNVPVFLIMAYDFHKAGGNPGPNFPLSGKETYGYDFTTMLSNFLKYIPPKRLGVIYGMYGYDWVVDDQGKAIGQGDAKSLLIIKKSIVEKCEALRCKMHRDNASSEMTITYTALDGKKHVVWYEDEVSVRRKQDMAREMGVGTSSFWAYSFF